MGGNQNSELRKARKLHQKSIGPENYDPAIALPPSDFIRDYLEAKEWNQAILADVTGLSEKHISQLMNNRAAITDDTARKLAHALGADPRFWMNLQFDYERDRRAGKPIYEEIERKRILYEKIPSLNQAIRYGMVGAGQTVEKLSAEVLSLLGLDSFDDLLNPESQLRCMAALRTHRRPQDRFALAIWANSARRNAKAHVEELPEYQPERLADFREKVPGLTQEPVNGPLQAVRLLRNLGVTVMYHHPLKGTTVDGAAFWVDETHPVIALTVRKKVLDEFWFVLLHELGHIVKEGYFEDMDLVYGIEASEDPMEQAANTFAADTLIPPTEWMSFSNLAVNRRQRDLSPRRTELLDFANRVGVHPQIVAGRLRFEKLVEQSYFRRGPFKGAIDKKIVIQALFHPN